MAKIPDMKNFSAIMQNNAEALRLKANLLLNLYNISKAGELIEEFIKDFLTSALGSRFRITTGYIVYAEEKNKPFKFSPQVDLIIVDTLVPNVIFPQPEFQNKTEFVPQEAVVGIFEIKKTLNKRSVDEALKHISAIISAVNIKKDNADMYSLGGKIINGVTTNIRGNPILGIIGLENRKNKKGYELKHTFVDLIFSFQGFLQILVEKGTSTFCCEPITNPQNYNFQTMHQTSTNIYTALGCIIYYLQHTTGRYFEAMNYYFDKNIDQN